MPLFWAWYMTLRLLPEIWWGGWLPEDDE